MNKYNDRNINWSDKTRNWLYIGKLFLIDFDNLNEFDENELKIQFIKNNNDNNEMNFGVELNKEIDFE